MEAWQVLQLGDVCKIELGGTPARKNPRLWDPDKMTSNVWLSIADLPQTLHAHVTDSKEYISQEAAERAKLVREGTLLVSFKLTLGRLAYAGRDLYTNEAIAALTILDEQTIAKAYLYWYLTYFDWQKAAEGDHKIKGKTLNKAKLKVLPIHIPPLPEQERIVTILDEAFATIATATTNAGENLANARELFQSILDHRITDSADGWRMEELQQDVRFIDYRGRTPRKTEKGMRLVTAKNVKMGVVQQEPREYVDPGIYDDWMTRGIPMKGDVLFTTEAPLGNVAQLDTSERVVFAQRLITLQPDRNVVHPAMLHYALRSSTVQRRIQENATGATATGIKASLLKRIRVPLPEDISTQVRLAAELAEAERECKRLTTHRERKRELLAELKQSILHRAFTGELTADFDAANVALLKGEV